MFVCNLLCFNIPSLCHGAVHFWLTSYEYAYTWLYNDKFPCIIHCEPFVLWGKLVSPAPCQSKEKIGQWLVKILNTSYLTKRPRLSNRPFSDFSQRSSLVRTFVIFFFDIIPVSNNHQGTSVQNFRSSYHFVFAAYILLFAYLSYQGIFWCSQGPKFSPIPNEM